MEKGNLIECGIRVPEVLTGIHCNRVMEHSHEGINLRPDRLATLSQEPSGLLQMIQQRIETKFCSNVFFEEEISLLLSYIKDSVAHVQQVTKNLCNDLKAYKLHNYATHFEQVRSVMEYFVTLMSQKMTFLSDKFAELKLKDIYRTHDKVCCTICVKQIKEVKIQQIYDSLNANNPLMMVRPSVHEEQEEESMANELDIAMNQINRTRKRILSLNNEKTIFSLQQFLSENNNAMEVFFSDKTSYESAYDSRDMVGVMFKQFVTKFLDVSNNDIKPTVIKYAEGLADELFRIRKKNIKFQEVGAQTVAPYPTMRYAVNRADNVRSVKKIGAETIDELKKNQQVLHEHRTKIMELTKENQKLEEKVKSLIETQKALSSVRCLEEEGLKTPILKPEGEEVEDYGMIGKTGRDTFQKSQSPRREAHKRFKIIRSTTRPSALVDEDETAEFSRLNNVSNTSNIANVGSLLIKTDDRMKDAEDNVDRKSNEASSVVRKLTTESEDYDPANTHQICTKKASQHREVQVQTELVLINCSSELVIAGSRHSQQKQHLSHPKDLGNKNSHVGVKETVGAPQNTNSKERRFTTSPTDDSSGLGEALVSRAGRGSVNECPGRQKVDSSMRNLKQEEEYNIESGSVIPEIESSRETVIKKQLIDMVTRMNSNRLDELSSIYFQDDKLRKNRPLVTRGSRALNKGSTQPELDTTQRQKQPARDSVTKDQMILELQKGSVERMDRALARGGQRDKYRTNITHEPRLTTDDADSQEGERDDYVEDLEQQDKQNNLQRGASEKKVGGDQSMRIRPDRMSEQNRGTTYQNNNREELTRVHSLKRVEQRLKTEIESRESGSQLLRSGSQRLKPNSKEPIDYFGKQDLIVLFGSLEAAYEFELTPNRRIPLNGKHKRNQELLISRLYKHLEGLKKRKEWLYQKMKSFVKFPYQSVMNQFDGLVIQSTTSFSGFSNLFSLILNKHSGCANLNSKPYCLHFKEFLKKLEYEGQLSPKDTLNLPKLQETSQQI